MDLTGCLRRNLRAVPQFPRPSKVVAELYR